MHALHHVLPTLAVFFDPRSVSPLHLAAARGGRWNLLWLFNRQIADVAAVPLLARFGAVVDITDASVEEAADEVAPFRPDGIVAYADRQLMSAAHLAEHLGLAHNSPEVVNRLTDKHAQRRALEEAGVAVPGYWLIRRDTTDAEIASLARGAHFPVVVKPRHGDGSRDTAPARDLDELRARIAGSRGDGDLVVEEFLPDGVARDQQIIADYVSVETAVAGGELRHIAVTGCFPLATPFRESGNFVPSALAPADTEAVQRLAADAIRALGVTSGITHTEIKLTPSGPCVIEVNGRIGGDLPDLLRLAAGRDMFEISAQVALHGRLPDDVPAQCDQVGFIMNVQPDVGASSLESIEGLNETADLPGVEAVTLNRRPGDRLDWRDGTYGYLYSVLGSAADHDAMLRMRDEVLQHVCVRYGD